MGPLYETIKTPIVKGDEEILILLTSIMEKQKKVSPYQVAVIPHLFSVLQTQSNKLDNLFELLNDYMVYGTSIFYDPSYQQEYFKIAFLAFNNEDSSAHDSEIGEGALLIHLGI